MGAAENVGVSGPLGASPANNPGSIILGGGYLEYSSVNQNDYSGRFSTAANQCYNANTDSQNVIWATPLVSSGGSLGKTGAGMLSLTGSNTFTGPMTISAGTLQVFGGGVLGGGNYPAAIVDNATLAINTSSTRVCRASFRETAQFQQLGSGITTLAASSTYSGITTLGGGTLNVAPASREPRDR